jgi:Ca2+-binding EF-hand superfamily protein
MKNIILYTLVGAVVLALLPGVSTAGHHYHGCSGMKLSGFSEMDADNDGFISFEEFSSPHLKQYKRVFDMLDLNDDGEIDQEERTNFLESHGYEEDSES